MRQQYEMDGAMGIAEGQENFDQADTDKFKDENMYKYHENTQSFDPLVQPYSYFYVTISGQIQFGEFMDLDGLALSYRFVAGEDWNVAGGSIQGDGQHSFKSIGKNQRMVWDLPFEVTFRSMNPHGWP